MELTSEPGCTTNEMPTAPRPAGGLRWRWLALVVVLLLASCGRATDLAATATAATVAVPTAGAGSCPISKPPNPPFVPPVPPAPSSAAGRLGEFWYGTSTLWTSLRLDGAWRGLPYSEGAYTQKVFWWSRDYDWQSLTVTGVRTDGVAPPLRASGATNAFAEDIGSSILVGVEIPAAGCWEISGHLKGVTLSFVVRVFA